MADTTTRVRLNEKENNEHTPDEREAMRRAAILEAARKLFQRYGYKKTTMDEIARDAGITKPTVYTYFSGKKDILVSLVEWEGQKVLSKGLEVLDEKASVIEQLDSMFVSVDDFLKEDSFLQGIATRDPDVLTPEVVRVAFDFERKIIDSVEKILEKGMKEGAFRGTDARLMAYAIVRLHEAFTFTAFFELEGYDKEKINDFFIETMVAMMQPLTSAVPMPKSRAGRMKKA